MINYCKLLYFLLTISICWTNASNAQYFGLSDQNRFSVLIESIEQNHVQYASLVDSVDERFRATLVNNLDPSGKYFLKSDEKKINDLLTRFKTANWEQSAAILDSCYVHYRDRIIATIRFLESLETCDFNEKDCIVLVPFSEKLVYSKDQAEFEKRWIRNLKYHALLDNLGDTVVYADAKSRNMVLNELWNEEIENTICELKTLIIESGELKEFIFDTFLNTYAQSFDPHTEYFSITENEIFNSSLSSQIFTPGFFIQPSGSNYYISELSPKIASEHVELHVGDEIVGIYQKMEQVNPACISEKNMYNYFYGEADSIIQVKIKCPKDQLTRDYQFIKTASENAFNKSLGFHLKSPSIKVGYLALPSFYVIQDGEGTSSGNDLAALILEMKASDPDAMILDLRSNGGGSIQEAINMAGLFIDYGPLFLTRSNTSVTPTLIKDMKKGQLFDGKLIIMVNQYSASASELIATTLQTYPNTLVVGTNTFGKSSGQEIIPLYSNYELFGYAKITTLEIFRYDGITVQQQGVVPDILIPSGLPSKLQSESELTYPLKFNESSKRFKPLSTRSVPVDQLSQRSAARVSQNEALKYMKHLETTMNKAFSNEMVLDLRSEQFQWPLEDIKEVMDTSAQYKVTSINSGLLLDSVSNAFNMKLIQEDPILNETVKIIEDWISITNKND